MARYPTVEQFRRMMRSGKRADGTSIAVMPFASLRAMSDAELEALNPRKSGTYRSVLFQSPAATFL